MLNFISKRIILFIEEFLPELKRYILPLMDLYVSLYIITKKEKTIKKSSKVLLIGQEPEVFYIANLIYSDNSFKIEKKKKIFILNLSKVIRFYKRHIDIIIVRVNNFWKRLFLQKFIWIPEFIGFERKGNIDFDKITEENSINKKMRKKIRKFDRKNFNWIESHFVSDFDYFYNQMYKPFIKQKFKKFAYIHSYYYLKKCFEKGGLFLITYKNNLQIGILYKINKPEIEFKVMGVQNKNLKSGAFFASYYYTLVWMNKENISRCYDGRARSFLKNGVLRNKRRWGMEIIPPLFPQANLGIKVINWKKRIEKFFKNNPFIFMDQKGRFNALIFIKKEDSLNIFDIQGIYRKYWIPGLHKLYIIPSFAVKKDIFERNIKEIDVEKLKKITEIISIDFLY